MTSKGLRTVAGLVVVIVLTLSANPQRVASVGGTPTLLSPPDGATLTSFTAALTWSNPPGVTQYYLEVLPVPGVPGGPPDGPGITLVRNAETSFTIQPPIFGQGNYVLLSDMTYTWRIQVSDKATYAPPGDPSYGPAAQRTFRTPRVSSTTVILMAPAGGSTVTTLTPTFQWQNGNPNVFYYEIQLSKDPTFNIDPTTATAAVYWELVHGGVTNPPNSYTVRPEFPLEPNTTYHWRVRPRIQGDGAPVAWPPTFSFYSPAAVNSTKIVFMSSRDGNEEIYVMLPDGSSQRRLTNNPARDTSPAWSPDGTKIAFSSERDGNFEIYVMNADGNGQTRLTNNPAQDGIAGFGIPDWSPDGTKIAFSSDRDGNFEIYVMNADGSSQTRLTNNPAYDLSPVWSPDGTRIAFSSDGNGSFTNFAIYLMNADGSGLTRLTNNPIGAGLGDGIPDWSPQNTKIAFISDRDGQFEIYVMNTDGSGQTRLTNNPALDSSPAWSPDERRIAFHSDRDGNREIYVMNADGSGQTRLTNNPAVDLWPDWSPK